MYFKFFRNRFFVMFHTCLTHRSFFYRVYILHTRICGVTLHKHKIYNFFLISASFLRFLHLYSFYSFFFFFPESVSVLFCQISTNVPRKPRKNCADYAASLLLTINQSINRDIFETYSIRHVSYQQHLSKSKTIIHQYFVFNARIQRVSKNYFKKEERKQHLSIYLKQIAQHAASLSTTGINSALFLRKCSLFSKGAAICMSPSLNSLIFFCRSYSRLFPLPHSLLLSFFLSYSTFLTSFSLSSLSLFLFPSFLFPIFP